MPLPTPFVMPWIDGTAGAAERDASCEPAEERLGALWLFRIAATGLNGFDRRVIRWSRNRDAAAACCKGAHRASVRARGAVWCVRAWARAHARSHAGLAYAGGDGEGEGEPPLHSTRRSRASPLPAVAPRRPRA